MIIINYILMNFEDSKVGTFASMLGLLQHEWDLGHLGTPCHVNWPTIRVLEMELLSNCPPVNTNRVTEWTLSLELGLQVTCP